MNTDTDIRHEENNKIHSSVISWLVQILVKESKNKLLESEVENEMLILHQDVLIINISFEVSILNSFETAPSWSSCQIQRRISGKRLATLLLAG